MSKFPPFFSKKITLILSGYLRRYSLNTFGVLSVPASSQTKISNGTFRFCAKIESKHSEIQFSWFATRNCECQFLTTEEF